MTAATRRHRQSLDAEWSLNTITRPLWRDSPLPSAKRLAAARNRSSVALDATAARLTDFIGVVVRSSDAASSDAIELALSAVPAQERSDLVWQRTWGANGRFGLHLQHGQSPAGDQYDLRACGRYAHTLVPEVR